MLGTSKKGVPDANHFSTRPGSLAVRNQPQVVIYTLLEVDKSKRGTSPPLVQWEITEINRNEKLSPSEKEFLTMSSARFNKLLSAQDEWFTPAWVTNLNRLAMELSHDATASNRFSFCTNMRCKSEQDHRKPDGMALLLACYRTPQNKTAKPAELSANLTANQPAPSDKEENEQYISIETITAQVQPMAANRLSFVPEDGAPPVKGMQASPLPEKALPTAPAHKASRYAVRSSFTVGSLPPRASPASNTSSSGQASGLSGTERRPVPPPRVANDPSKELDGPARTSRADPGVTLHQQSSLNNQPANSIPDTELVSYSQSQEAERAHADIAKKPVTRDSIRLKQQRSPPRLSNQPGPGDNCPPLSPTHTQSRDRLQHLPTNQQAQPDEALQPTKPPLLPKPAPPATSPTYTQTAGTSLSPPRSSVRTPAESVDEVAGLAMQLQSLGVNNSAVEHCSFFFLESSGLGPQHQSVQIERLLRATGENSWLVRHAAVPENFELCIWHSGESHVLVIQQAAGNQYVLGNRAFPSVFSLLAYYVRNPLSAEIPVPLGSPALCQRRAPQ